MRENEELTIINRSLAKELEVYRSKENQKEQENTLNPIKDKK